MGVNDRANGEVGALSDALLQFLDTVEIHMTIIFTLLRAYGIYFPKFCFFFHFNLLVLSRFHFYSQYRDLGNNGVQNTTIK